MPGLDIVVEIATRDEVASVFATAALNAADDACRVPQPAAKTATAAMITTSSRSRIATSPFRCPWTKGPPGCLLRQCRPANRYPIARDLYPALSACVKIGRAGLDDREALHFDQGCRVPQPRHADGGHRRVIPPGQPPPHRADLPGVRPVVLQVGHVHRQAGELVWLSPAGAQGGQQPAERLLELRDDTGRGDLAAGVDRGLTGQEDHRAATDDGVREAAWRAQLRRVHPLDTHQASLSASPLATGSAH